MTHRAALGAITTALLVGNLGCVLPKSHFEGSKEMTAAFREMVKCGSEDEKNTDCNGKYKGKTYVGEYYEMSEDGDAMGIKLYVASRTRWFMCFALPDQKEKYEKLQPGQIVKFKGKPGDIGTRGSYSIVAIDYCTIEEVTGAPNT